MLEHLRDQRSRSHFDPVREAVPLGPLDRRQYEQIARLLERPDVAKRPDLR
jgi:hypothetical protein